MPQRLVCRGRGEDVTAGGAERLRYILARERPASMNVDAVAQFSVVYARELRQS